MVMPWTDSQICPSQPYGKHILVRCKGCGSKHHTKNIGWRKKDNTVSTARTLFDITLCSCADPAEHPVTHNCDTDHIPLH